MRVLVRVFGDISSIIGKRHELKLPEGAALSTATKALGEYSNQIPGYLGEFRIGGKDLTILVNGKSIDMLQGTSTPLKEGDEIVILQPTAGG